MQALLFILLTLIAIAIGIVALVFLIVPFFKGLAWLITNTFKAIGWLIMHVFRFIGGMIGDSFRAIGAVILSVIYTPLIVLNIVIGRWSAAAHFARCFQDELLACVYALYRVCIGHPARFLLLSPLTEGLEQRLPQAVAQAPGSDRPRRAVGAFDGYTIVGSLKGGGSGGKLYVAEPDAERRAIFARNGQAGVDQVVIKSFSLEDGSSLPQIIRESRALEAARALGFVLEHKQTAERFYYVMPYVPGDSLTTVTQRLHVEAGADGLRHSQLQLALRYADDLLETLRHYHEGGLWHKDIKPDNIIVGPDGRAHLVDLGLITPLRSAMTLTTHGTEYFRDPELVRMALRGVKVHEVDGVKFDIYGAGAVLFSVIENSFPAHGGLSQITRSCPEALRWIIRRAMTDLSKRYDSAAAMLSDLRAVASAPDPFLVKPADLPSMRGFNADDEPIERPETPVAVAAAHTPIPPMTPPPLPHTPAPTPAAVAEPATHTRWSPRIRVLNWMTGGYLVDSYRPHGSNAAAPSPPVAPAPPIPPAPAAPVRQHGPAKEQLRHAQQRVRAAQQRARKRMNKAGHYSNRPTAAMIFAVLLFFAVIAALSTIFIAGMTLTRSGPMASVSTTPTEADVKFRVGPQGETITLLNPRFDESTFVTAFGAPSVAEAHARAAVLGKGRVLLVNRNEDDPTRAAWISDRLSANGFTTLGLGAEQTDIDLLASIRHNGVDIPSLDAWKHVRSWMMEDAPELDYTIIIPRDADEPWLCVPGFGRNNDDALQMLQGVNP